MPDDLSFITASGMLRRFADGSLTPVDAIEATLARLAALEPVLNAFQLIDEDGARAEAEASARRWREGRPVGPLDGVPVSIKDIVAMRGFPTRAGSLTSSDEPAAEDAPPVARLREAGAVLFGKTTTSEYGWKGMTDTPLRGVTRNPWNPAVTPGGSSGGAGASVAAGVSPLAHGNDGGGSVRIPASYCGLVGIKPSFGRVPQYPNDSPFSTLVSNGPLARNVADAVLMMNVMAGPDARDWLAIPNEGWDSGAELGRDLAGLRIGLSLDLGGADPVDEVRSAVATAAEVLAGLGAEVGEAGPLIAPLRPRFEAYWLAGFARTLSEVPEERRHLLDPRFRELAEQGGAVGLDAVYRGHAERAALAAEFGGILTRYDVLLTPTMPTLPPATDTPYHSQAFDRWRDAVPFTVPFNLTGLPAASIPCAVSRDGLPIGLQIVGPRGAEARVVRVAAAYEAANPLPWPHPALAWSLQRIEAGEATQS